jgi:hypothetical protein
MVRLAQKQLRYKAALHPLLFELLPPKFTIPQLQNLYEGVLRYVVRQPQLHPQGNEHRACW